MAEASGSMLKIQAHITSLIHAFKRLLERPKILSDVRWGDLSNRKSLKRIVDAIVASG